MGNSRKLEENGLHDREQGATGTHNVKVWPTETLPTCKENEALDLCGGHIQALFPRTFMEL